MFHWDPFQQLVHFGLLKIEATANYRSGSSSIFALDPFLCSQNLHKSQFTGEHLLPRMLMPSLSCNTSLSHHTTLHDSEGMVLATDVRRLDNSIHQISVNKTNHTICWIVIYLVDSVIHFSNNKDLVAYFCSH